MKYRKTYGLTGTILSLILPKLAEEPSGTIRTWLIETGSLKIDLYIFIIFFM